MHQTKLNRAATTALALITYALCACSANALTGAESCTTIAMIPGRTLTSCVESIGLTADQLRVIESQCRANASAMVTSTFTHGPCSRTDAVGGCRLASGGFSQTTWYYLTIGIPAGTYQTSCETTLHGTWVTP